MKTKNIIIILLSLHSLLSSAYEKRLADYPIPRNIKGCIKLLDKTMSADEKELIRTLPEDSICKHEKFTYRKMGFFSTWIQIEKRPSRLEKYFDRKGFYNYDEIYETILVSYHRYLNNQEIDLEKQNERFTERRKIREEEQDKRAREYQLRIEMDSINGVYIPKDIEDCCVQLDKIINEKDKEYIKGLSVEDLINDLHFGLGIWIGNIWGLWGGSRLQQYFLDKKIDHPNDMSGEILRAYHNWLNKK